VEILVAPNSFKECSDSVAIAEIISSFFSVKRGYKVISSPISDGGDGFLKVCENKFNLSKIYYTIPAPFNGKKIKCCIGYSKKNKSIFIESAALLGLNLIPSEKRHPLELCSRGLGVVLNKICLDIERCKLDVEKITIGIGGTGTNDMGIGMLCELGMTLYGSNDFVLEPIPQNFRTVKRIRWQKPDFPFTIDLVVDVNNPLLGKDGASSVYGKQKGLTALGIKIAETGFENIIKVSLRGKMIKNKKFIPGAGGGLSAGFLLFLNAGLISSDRFISGNLGITKTNKHIVVITGEGRFDKQSFMNKATGTIIKKFSNRNNKIFLVCGTIGKEILNRLPENVYIIELAKYFKSKDESISYYKKGIRLACNEIFECLHSVPISNQNSVRIKNSDI
jgi:glycerate kinase